jgi:anhydro-N-acetylmuramic acid kinase
MDIEYGEFIGKQINKFIRQYSLKPNIIASHGHTVFHQPEKRLSIQIGNGLAIQAITGVTTINNFRQLDVILNGQGAPLVPVGDSYLFHDYNFCLNLGGFSNVSFNHSGKRVAFDICPLNIVLNQLARKLDMPFDDQGMIARKGTLNTKILDKLNRLKFYQLPYPKSLSAEWVNQKILPILKQCPDPRELLSTFTHHIAQQINHSLNQYLKHTGDKPTVMVTGGGTYNEFLLELLEHAAKGKLTYIIPDKTLIDFKEALIFAFIGVLRLRGDINTLKSVTGANHDSCGGVIYDH